MEKKKVRKSQIIAAALLAGFDNISDFELDLFIEIFLKNNPNHEIEYNYITDIAKYINVKNDKISLWDKNSVKELKNIAGIAMNFFDSFDYEEFLIRKIWKNGSCSEYDVNTLFSKIEQEKIKELEESSHLIVSFNDDNIYDNYKEYKLSPKGIIKYFKSVYKEEFDEFETKLKSLKYDINLLDDYLMSINYDNLERDAELVEVTMLGKILDINAFDEYCARHDRAKYVDEYYNSHTNNDSKKESDFFTGRMDDKKRKLVLEFLDKHPSSIAAIGYGSGVIMQANSNSDDKKQIDLIIVVDDLKSWINENMKMHPEEFTKSTMRYFKNASLKKLEKGAPVVYFSSIEYKGELIKMGIIFKGQFLSSCYDKTSSYVPFRLEKAIELIRCNDEEITKAIIYDHRTTLITALLMLDEEHLTVRDLMEKICSLSYMGDFRMKIHCEDPNKVRNIVDKQFEYFKEDYDKVNNGYFTYLEDGKISINYEKIKIDSILLPYEIRGIIEKYRIDVEKGRTYIDSELQDYYKKVAEDENLKQAIKGISTVGIEKAISYGLRKVKKGRKK